MSLMLKPANQPAIKIIFSTCDLFAPAANNNEIVEQAGKYIS
jgi:hypothetical protein